jgi:hypothetical protein
MNIILILNWNIHRMSLGLQGVGLKQTSNIDNHIQMKLGVLMYILWKQVEHAYLILAFQSPL